MNIVRFLKTAIRSPAAHCNERAFLDRGMNFRNDLIVSLCLIPLAAEPGLFMFLVLKRRLQTRSTLRRRCPFPWTCLQRRSIRPMGLLRPTVAAFLIMALEIRVLSWRRHKARLPTSRHDIWAGELIAYRQHLCLIPAHRRGL